MRLFFAAMLPSEVQEKLGGLRAGLGALPTRAAWTAPENLHITLKFLGEVPDAQVNEVALAGKEALPPVGAMQLRADHLLFFPPGGNARVLGAGFSGDTQKLTEIAAAIEAACQRLGFPRENRAFTPHATLARFRDGLHAVHRPKIEEAFARLPRIAPFELQAVQLVQSKLSPRGSEYAVVATLPLNM